MPEGDALYRVAQRLQVLVGERVQVQAPHPAAAVKGIAEQLDGRVLEGVEAVGKNVLLSFEGGVVLRSHLRMKGRWHVHEGRRDIGLGKPWLVLRSATHEAVLWHGPILELDDRVRRRLGPDILALPPAVDAMVANLRALPAGMRLGEALQVQRAVAGIGNMWAAAALWEVKLSPWLALAETSDDELRSALSAAARLMHGRLRGLPGRRTAYRRANQPCPRCGTLIRSWPLGDEARMAYWCPACQRGGGP